MLPPFVFKETRCGHIYHLAGYVDSDQNWTWDWKQQSVETRHLSFCRCKPIFSPLSGVLGRGGAGFAAEWTDKSVSTDLPFD